MGGAGPPRPTDGVFAFRLAPVAPLVAAPGLELDVTEVARRVLGGDADTFERHVARWPGPEDALPDGSTPWASPQLRFRFVADAAPTPEDVETVLRGTALVRLRADGSRDVLLRDHHMVDVVLVQHATGGTLPRRLFHADRHSDWCTDGFLNRRRPDQAATWWALLRGLKRPSDAAPVLEESDVVFTSERAPHEPWMSGRPYEEPLAVPWFVDRRALHWSDVARTPGAFACDWVSLDLDDFLPSPQFGAARGLLADEGFLRMWRRASVRVLCLSPQFTNGGDRHDTWRIAGRRTAMRRFLALVDRLSR